MPAIINPIVQEIKVRPLDWLLRLVSVVILALASYITIRLIPIYQNIESLNFRVSAIEERNENVNPLVNEFIEQKGDIRAIKTNILEIKQDVRDIKNFLNVR